MENAMAALCCRVPGTHKEKERLSCSKITDYIRKQSNHKGHLGTHEQMTTEKCSAQSSALLDNRPGFFFFFFLSGPDSLTGKELHSGFLHFERRSIHLKKQLTSACPFPHSPHQKALHRHCRLVLKRHKTSHDESCVFVCEDGCTREVPGSLQHVLISASSSSSGGRVVWEAASTR